MRSRRSRRRRSRRNRHRRSRRSRHRRSRRMMIKKNMLEKTTDSFIYYCLINSLIT